MPKIPKFKIQVRSIADTQDVDYFTFTIGHPIRKRILRGVGRYNKQKKNIYIKE